MLQKLKENISRVIIGNGHTIDLILACLLAGGHILLEDVPGTGKTVMAKSLAKSIGAPFGRIQFTPDLLPSDVTGLNYFDAKKGEFIFSEGPVFCSILLADEINRATPKTQSSLLECMAEGQVTVDGVTRRLPAPFLVIATQNPLEALGTFPLPEAQKDRFLMQLSMENLSPAQEVSMIRRFLTDEPLENLTSVCTREQINALQEQCRHIYLHADLLDYITNVVQATRRHPKTAHGVSPRGTLSLVRACQGFAMVMGRDYVVPEDIKAVAIPVLAHRLSLHAASLASRGEESIIREILDTIGLPTEDWRKR